MARKFWCPVDVQTLVTDRCPECADCGFVPQGDDGLTSTCHCSRCTVCGSTSHVDEVKFSGPLTAHHNECDECAEERRAAEDRSDEIAADFREERAS